MTQPLAEIHIKLFGVQFKGKTIAKLEAEVQGSEESLAHALLAAMKNKKEMVHIVLHAVEHYVEDEADSPLKSISRKEAEKEIKTLGDEIDQEGKKEKEKKNKVIIN